jgi:hypothetical protein
MICHLRPNDNQGCNFQPGGLISSNGDGLNVGLQMVREVRAPIE